MPDSVQVLPAGVKMRVRLSIGVHYVYNHPGVKPPEDLEAFTRLMEKSDEMIELCRASEQERPYRTYTICEPIGVR